MSRNADGKNKISGNSSVRLEHSLWERRVAGSNPVSPTYTSVAQLEEQEISTLWVVGSNPAGGAYIWMGGREAQCKSLQNSKAAGSNPASSLMLN